MAASALPASGLNREHISDLHFVATCAEQAHLLVESAARPSQFSEAAHSVTLDSRIQRGGPGMKWWVVRQRAGTFDFREGEVVRFAQAHA